MKIYLYGLAIIVSFSLVFGIALPALISAADDVMVTFGFVILFASPVILFLLFRQIVRQPAVQRLINSMKDQTNA